MSAVKRLAPPLASGLLFGAGLAIGGMTDPARVRGFLDLFGRWDPTLVFVMAMAVAVMAAAWRLQSRMAHPLFAEKWSLPERSDFDAPLLIGASLFGIGWGLSGLCPGPAIASLALHPASVSPFILAMLAGMAVHHFTLDRGKGPNR